MKVATMTQVLPKTKRDSVGVPKRKAEVMLVKTMPQDVANPLTTVEVCFTTRPTNKPPTAWIHARRQV